MQHNFYGRYPGYRDRYPRQPYYPRRPRPYYPPRRWRRW